MLCACAPLPPSPALDATQLRPSPISPAFPDLAYADKSALEKLDLYLPKSVNTPAPVVIWIHGGGLRVGDKRAMPRRYFGPPPKPRGPDGPYQPQVPDVVALTEKGYAVASLNHRLGWSMITAAPAALRDAKAAVRFLRAHAKKFNLDPDRFAVWGNSAGGYLAAMLGVTGDQATDFDDPALGNSTESSAVQAVVVWFGAEDRLVFPSLDIVSYIPTAKRLPPFLIVNGDADPIISVAQARRLHDAVVKAGGSATLNILPGAGHEDPIFMESQMIPTFTFIDRALGHENRR